MIVIAPTKHILVLEEFVEYENVGLDYVGHVELHRYGILEFEHDKERMRE